MGVTSPSGGALQYQWTRSGGVNVVDTAMLVSGATTDTLNLLDVGNNDQAQQAETYVVQVTDPTSNQIVVSNRALLQIVCESLHSRHTRLMIELHFASNLQPIHYSFTVRIIHIMH